jgi:isocitrate dehydrogenase kinase/phosphatase
MKQLLNEFPNEVHDEFENFVIILNHQHQKLVLVALNLLLNQTLDAFTSDDIRQLDDVISQEIHIC